MTTHAPAPQFLRPLVAAAAAEPGAQWFERLAPPADGTGRASAVLIALAEFLVPTPRVTGRPTEGATGGVGGGPAAPGPAVLLIRRAAALRRHPGQVAFPGGAVDPVDVGPEATALREAREEVGLDPPSVTPVLTLPTLYLAYSGFLVTPVVAHWHDPHPVAPVDPGEVARAGVVSIHDLVDPANRFTVRHPSGMLGPGFDVDGFFVWGFTALLLDHVLTLAGWNAPWDRQRRRPIPQ